MKERSIIMSSESVRAILDDRKTQTRRVIKPQPIFNGTDLNKKPYFIYKINIVILTYTRKVTLTSLSGIYSPL